jgi:phosphatidyl-myo-inositol alpha-mannosyltransferase
MDSWKPSPIQFARTTLTSNNRPLRLAMASYYLPSESKMGVGHQAHALANEFVKRGHDVTMFSSCRASDGALYRTETLSVAGSMRTLKFAGRLRAVDWRRFDVFHAHNGDFLLWGDKGRPHIRTVHGSSLREAIHIAGLRPRAAMGYYAVCESVATLVADQSVAVSRNTQRWLPWVRTVIPNGVDLSSFSPGEKSAEPTVLFVGTYHRRKRGRLLARVFEQEVLPRFPNAELWMVAEDSPPGPGRRVFGRVSDGELQQLYRRAWVFCLPSTYEGFGIPYIEAMASGTAVVASPNAGALEVTGRGQYGAVVDDARLGGTLVRLLASNLHRHQLADAALLHVRQFDLGAVAERYETLYRILNSKHVPPSASAD